MKFPRNAKLFRGQLDAAPFAGVFFLLVLFLLLNTNLVFTPGVRIELPEMTGARLPGLDNPSVVVAMDLSGQIFFQNQAIKEKELSARLREAAAQTRDLVVVIQVDKGVALDAFYHLSKLASEAGVRRVLLASRPPIAPHAPLRPGP